MNRRGRRGMMSQSGRGRRPGLGGEIPRNPMEAWRFAAAACGLRERLFSRSLSVLGQYPFGLSLPALYIPSRTAPFPPTAFNAAVKTAHVALVALKPPHHASQTSIFPTNPARLSNPTRTSSTQPPNEMTVIYIMNGLVHGVVFVKIG